MQLLNTIFVNTDLQHGCGHVMPATIEIIGDDAEIRVGDSNRVTLDVFFTSKRRVRYFLEGGRINRTAACPKCGGLLPSEF